MNSLNKGGILYHPFFVTISKNALIFTNLKRIYMKMIKLLSILILSAVLLSATIKLPKALREVYQFIPAGLALLDGDTLSIQSYYMQSSEVTNGEYNAFLSYLKANNRTEDYEKARVRNENWLSEFKPGNHKPLADNYHVHEAYANFPVVNVTHEGAMLYATYATKIVNEQLAKLGQKVVVRLPYHTELIRAGAGDDLKRPYTWNGPYMRNSRGDYLCNFTRLPENGLTRDENGHYIISKEYKSTVNLEHQHDVLAPSKSYWPSEFGVYNLNGNAAEMTMKPGEAVGGSWRDLGYDVRLQSVLNYDQASCRVGFRTVFTVSNEN